MEKKKQKKKKLERDRGGGEGGDRGSCLRTRVIRVSSPPIDEMLMTRHRINNERPPYSQGGTSFRLTEFVHGGDEGAFVFSRPQCHPDHVTCKKGLNPSSLSCVFSLALKYASSPRPNASIFCATVAHKEREEKGAALHWLPFRHFSSVICAPALVRLITRFG